ncbi:hypothetical protein [Clostridium sp. OS1-26]|uniref:hypothetical protein n=1 Tax=Clostridium sp. OS1-26 TaxID=3070681 RepID=UPI0027DF00D4|nr:hypothetical protein [Clostridium sp. OS1-26]WML37505.1 hypothetical protein RCG18_13350 [Clostridium sp. OS1-26]
MVVYIEEYDEAAADLQNIEKLREKTESAIQDLSNLKAQVSLGKYDADKVKVGQEAVIKAPGKSSKSFSK